MTSVGEPIQGGRTRGRPLYMHRLLAPESLAQEDLFVYRNWTTRRCYPDPRRPESPLWWMIDGEPERFIVIDGERRRASLSQLPARRLLDLPDEALLRLPLPQQRLRSAQGVGLAVPLTGITAAAEEEEADLDTRIPDGDGPDLAEREPAVVAADRRTEPAPDSPVMTAIGHAPSWADRTREDPFQRSLGAIVAELTQPLTVTPERLTRVPVRIVFSEDDGECDVPLPLPTRPELVSGDFLAREALRPSLVPNERLPSPARPLLGSRTMALIAGVAVLFLGLALWLFQ